MSKRSYWTDVARDIVKEQQKRFGRGWELLHPALRRAVCVERVATVCMSWSVKDTSGAEMKEDLRELYAEVREALGDSDEGVAL